MACNCLIALVVCDRTLAAFDPLGLAYFTEIQRLFDAMIRDPRFAYITPAGYADTLQGIRIEIGREGLRSPAFSAEKAAGGRRIMLLGDSVVFGWAVADEDTVGFRLRSRLASAHPSWDAVVAGVPSWNTRNELELMRAKGFAYEPDVLVLVVLSNDAEPNFAGALREDPRRLRDEAERERLNPVLPRAMTEVSYLAAWLELLLRRRQVAASETLLYAAGSLRWKDADLAVAELVDECGRRGIALVPFLYGQASAPHVVAYSTAFGRRGVQTHAFPDELYEERYRTSFADPHPNAHGHAIMADAIYEILREYIAG